MIDHNIKKALYFSNQIAWDFQQTGLSESALLSLCLQLKTNKSYHIIELGGGQSTIFWKIVKLLNYLSISVTSLQHDKHLAHKLNESPCIFEDFSILVCKLKQITDDEREQIFSNPKESIHQWSNMGSLVPEVQYNHFTIRNTFYTPLDHLSPKPVDIMILDGPHGNGRSLAFPLFYHLLKPNSLVLLDDFDHYPFLSDLERIFKYTTIASETHGEQRWALVELNELRSI